MIIYFADREMQILGHATTNLPDGFVIIEDLKTEEIETGVASFDCRIGFNDENRALLEEMTEAGNYLLRSNDGENEFYTIIETEIDTKNQDIYVYAEDAGLDLLNEIAPEFEADASYTAEWYINKYIVDSGFEIGVNEIPASSKRALSWDGESSVTERLASIANSFGGYEISYSFDIKGLEITNKYVNIYAERGKELGEHLRLNRDIDRIVTTKSVANLATAFVCEGGTPEGDNDPPPITLKGYKYDDGDFYVDGDKLKSRNANKKWSRYVWNKEPNRMNDGEGYIVRPYSYDTLSQSELCNRAITELKKVCDMEVNYEIDIGKLPDGVKIGDRINIVDDAGELYVSSRILKLETSVTEQTHAATLGEHLIKKSGISQKVIELAEQFAQTAKSAERALSIANTAKSNAQSALTQANEVAEEVEKAQQSANEAATTAANALQSATNAQTAADEAKSAVDNVEKSVENLETTVNNAQAAADNAQQAATTAQTKAAEAEQAAIQAKADAADAKAAVVIAEGKAETAITKADTAQSTAETAKTEATTAKETAEAAKLDAKKAEEDIASLGERLETVTTTMEADYARKTDLTESEAHLQSQISQNAGLISSTVSMLSVIDETANDAQDQAEKAQKRAEEAQRQADQATADALAAQEAADEAAQSATNAQTEADTARAAADTAQSVADQAETELATAKAELDEVLSRADATEAEITAAQNAVNTAQAAADKAKADASVAIQNATEAQKTADQAKNSANEAQAAANTAASYAKIAQSVASEAENATAAQDKADEAAEIAAEAQVTANTAVTDAANAQAKADRAVADALAADQTAKNAAAQVTQAQANLDTAKQTLADTLAKVDATEAEIAAAEKSVEDAQASVDAAIKNAAEATGAAELAAAFAKNAQAVADEAQIAADNAQKAADDAQAAADEAKAAADSLAVRVTTAETKITQNTEAINLRATKTEVVDYINKVEVGGRNLLLNSSFEENADGWGGAENITDVSNTVTGTGAVALNNFNPASNDVGVKLSSKNLLDFTTAKPYGTGTIEFLENGLTYTGNWYITFYVSGLEIGETYRFTCDYETTSPATSPIWRFRYTDGTTSGTASISQGRKAEKEVERIYFYPEMTSTIYTSTLTNIQLEKGTTTSSYTPYIDNFEDVTVSTMGKNLLNVPYDYSVNAFVNLQTQANLKAGVSYVFYIDERTFSADSNGLAVIIDGKSLSVGSGWVVGGKAYTFTPTVDNPLIYIYTNGWAYAQSEGITANIKGMRIYHSNFADSATEYEPYIEPVTYTANADGTVEGVTAISPNMTIMADSSVNVSATYVVAKGFTEKYGRQCALIHQSELQATKYVSQSVLGKLEPNTEYTMSGWGLTENIVPGTTSFSIMFYHSGYYDNNGVSTWFGYGNKGFVVNAGSGEWVHLVWTFKTDDKVSTATTTNVFVNTKDFTGDVYFCDLKLEKGNKATDWTPAPEDVDNAINESVSKVQTAVSDLALTAEGITASVQEMQKTTSDALGSINSNIETLSKQVQATMTAESVKMEIQSAIDNGVTKVTTSTGFVFDDTGLTIEKSNSQMKTQITEDGMKVLKNGSEVLVADHKGVQAKDLHAETYLIVGKNSRFEDKGNRTCCFWIGS